MPINEDVARALDMPPTQKRRSTRHEHVPDAEEDVGPEKPRLGRRESEPHAAEVTYLHDVLTTNFPQDRTTWDLHHYFMWEGELIDVLFDITYFRGYQIPYSLSYYDARMHENRRPTMAVNFISRSTYNDDIGMTVLNCQVLGIPIYVVFNPYLQGPFPLRAPFLRVYHAKELGKPHKISETYEICLKEPSSPDAEEEIDLSKVIDVRPDLLPFMFGIMQRKQVFEGGLPLYRLILIDRDTKKRLLTKTEKAWREAEEARRRAEEARQQLQKLKERELHLKESS